MVWVAVIWGPILPRWALPWAIMSIQWIGALFIMHHLLQNPMVVLLPAATAMTPIAAHEKIIGEGSVLEEEVPPVISDRTDTNHILVKTTGPARDHSTLGAMK